MPRKEGRFVLGKKKRSKTRGRFKPAEDTSPERRCLESVSACCSSKTKVHAVSMQPTSACDNEASSSTLSASKASLTVSRATKLLEQMNDVEEKNREDEELDNPMDISDDSDSEMPFNMDGYEFDEDEEQPTDEMNTSTLEKKMSICKTPINNECQDGDYEIIHSSFIKNLLSSVACPSCHCTGLQYRRPFTQGLATQYLVFCDSCGDDSVFEGYTSPKAGKRRDVNVRAVLGCRESGISHPRLKSLFAIMNLTTPLHPSTFNYISQEVHDASIRAAEKVMNDAAAYIRSKYEDGTFQPLNKRPTASGVPVSAVSYDGAWQTRGYSSHHGIGVAIDLETTLVVDTEVMSNYCPGCLRSPEDDTKEWDAWWEKHKPDCQNNHNGSAKLMEKAAAQAIFKRSICKRCLLFGTMLCDGDSSAYDGIRFVYDNFERDKEDCVNHIAKRMFNALMNLKKSNKKAFDRKLTEHMITKITNIYAANLKRAAPDVDKMRSDVIGGIFHMAATDKNPNHKKCPDGVDSWCSYKRAIANDETPPKHKPTYKHSIIPLIYPVIMRLTDKDLLARCARMKTQNANESFNSLVWKRAPKTEYRCKRSIETAVALATLDLNCGAAGITLVLEEMKLDLTHRLQAHLKKRVSTSVELARNKTKRLSKWKRKTQKLLQRTKEQQRAKKEGPSYQAGGFNAPAR